MVGRLEWISSHQCTSWGWARSTRFADEHPPCSSRFFFSPPLCPEILYLPPPTYPLLPTSYQAHPPSYLHPPTYQPTPPHSIAKAPETSIGCGAGAGAGPAGVGARPTRPRKGKMLTFFFCFFFCFVWRRLEKSSSFFAAEEKEGDRCRRFLLLPLFFCCTAT